MKTLIIGGAGFVGKYLIRELSKNKDSEIFVTKLHNKNINEKGCSVFDLDILNQENIKKLLKEIKPDTIFHLAAQSSVALSWKNPALTVDVNIKGVINLLEVIRNLEYTPRVVLIGSGEEYGLVSQNDMPIKETLTPNPQNIYAITKLAQNQIGTLYARSYGLDIILIRAFNHIGPTQSPQFVVSDFCKQVSEIEMGLSNPIMKVGNLSAQRDFTDVRDIVRAYLLLAEKGKSGETYNVGSGKSIKINEILNEILIQAKTDITVITDENKFRPIDLPVIVASIDKLSDCTQWSPFYNIKDTIFDVLNYWRSMYH